jgi:hypothetical protein
MRKGKHALLSRCFDAHQQPLDWIEEYQSYCTRMSPVSPSPQELALRRELYDTAIECLIVVKRLLEAIIYTDELLAIEVEVQALVQSLLDLQKQPSPKHSSLFMGHAMGVTRSVLLTRHQWESPIPHYYSCAQRRLASRKRYIDFNVFRFSHTEDCLQEGDINNDKKPRWILPKSIDLSQTTYEVPRTYSK